MADVGVVVVHYRREVELDRLLAELTSDHRLPADRIVVVDNGGDPDLIEGIRSRSGARWISLDNPGYGAAVNAGVRALDGVPYVLVLTHEARLELGAVPALAAALDREPRLLIAGPVLRDARSGRIWSAGGTTTAVRRLPRHQAAGAEEPPDPLPMAEWLDGSCFVLRREEFLDLGGVDERFFLYFEDVDLGWRATREGRGVRVIPEAVAWQSPGGHLDQYLATRNALLLFRVHRRRVALALFVGETVARLVLGGILRPRGARQRLARRWAGLRDGLRRA